jgi:multiple sugar transport system substrate-binding protein
MHSKQLIYARRRAIFPRAGSSLIGIALLSALSAGCIERPTTIDPPVPKPNAGVVLTVAVADPSDRELLSQLARTWSARTGGEVRVVSEVWNGSTDIGLIASADLARWAITGQLAEIPAELKSSAHPYRWDDLLHSYANRLTNWNGRTYALPVVGEGMILVYRKDRFDGKDGRPSAPPATWEELAEHAQKLGKNSLPPLPNDSERLLAEFFSAAASYDRLAVSRINAEELIRNRGRFFEFQFNPTTGDPRLRSPAFDHVAQLFQSMHAFRSSAPDAIAAFNSNKASIGVVTLADLARIRAEIKDKLGIASLPGSPFTFDDDGTKRPNEQQTINRVPYLGWGGRLGVVSAKCGNPSAAWEFLVEAGLPDTTSLDLIANPNWGAGPFRMSQLDNRVRARWFAYGLSAAETDRLIAALNENLGPGVQNYRLRLRTPNQHELAKALDEELRKAIQQRDKAKLSAAHKRWEEIINRQPREEWIAVLKTSLGL